MNDKQLKHMIRRRKMRGILLSVIVALLILTTESCATHYKHKKIKAVPCPCEKEQHL